MEEEYYDHVNLAEIYSPEILKFLNCAHTIMLPCECKEHPAGADGKCTCPVDYAEEEEDEEDEEMAQDDQKAVDQAFVATNNRINDVIERLMELERKFGEHIKRGRDPHGKI